MVDEYNEMEIVQSKEDDIDNWWETILAIDDITDSVKNVADFPLGTKGGARPRPAKFSKNWIKKYGNSGTHSPHDDKFCVLGDSTPLVELEDESEFIYFLEYIHHDKKKPYIAHCSCCDVHLTVSKKNISQHFAGIKHQVSKFKSQMEISAIFPAANDDDSYLWCKTCTVSFQCKTPADIYDHTKDRSDHDNLHETIMALIEFEDIDYDDWSKNTTEEDAFCNICLEHVKFNYNALKWHINGFKHKETSMY